MKISGFSFVRNGMKLYYPVLESIQSILPICDEFVVAVGEGDKDDNTREKIAALNDPKIRILDTKWNPVHFKQGVINALQTDVAQQACTGDWLFYLQADEVVHEKYLQVISSRCEQLQKDGEVEGLLFNFKHFWGDYDHYQNGHGWYAKEIRIIRNNSNIHSWQSAQSFRRYDYFESPRQPAGHHRLKVAKVDAEIYHYGWVRPPHLMQNKRKALDSVHWGLKKSKEYYEKAPKEFDYGPLNLLAEFKETHPKIMEGRIKALDWKDKLQYSGQPSSGRGRHKHERLKYRIISFIEKHLNGGNQIGGFRNYIILREK
jgi:hypothetical protein